MPSKHTKERLRVLCGAIETERGIPIAHMDREPGNGTSPVERDDTAHRIVLAYNAYDDLAEALRGMLTYWGSVKDARIAEDAAESVLEQYDATA